MLFIHSVNMGKRNCERSLRRFHGPDLEVAHVTNIYTPLTKTVLMTMSNCKGNGKVKSNFVSRKKKRHGQLSAALLFSNHSILICGYSINHPFISAETRFNFACGKESACNAGDLDSIPGSAKIPWRRK